jgi:uncharacterized NAD(P)/FAD-binding protein YdhS
VRFAAAAVLAIGAGSPGVRWAPDSLRAGGRFVADPWVPGALEDIPPAEDVLLVGTGLTMVDMALTLDRPGRVLHAVSRHGLLPRPHAAAPVPPVALPGTADDLASLRLLVRDHIGKCLRETRDWRPAVDGIRPRTAELWQRLSAADRRRFLAEDHAYWEVLRHRMPPSSAAGLARIRRAGRLTVSRGEVLAAEGGEVALTGGRVRVGAVVNCTGPDSDAQRNPLVARLVADGLAAPGPLGIGLATAPDGRLRPTNAPLWTLGAPRKGDLWETTAIPEIRQAADDLARSLVADVISVDDGEGRPA